MPMPRVGLPQPRAPRSRALTDEQASALRLEYQAGGTTTAALGTKYGVSQQTAHRIATGRLYSDLAHPPRVAWTQPDIRTWGNPHDAELRALKPMLRAHPGRELQVKRTRSRPALPECWIRWGFDVELRKIDTGHWGTFVSWPADSAAHASIAS